jgi:hypothetical protein
MEEFDILDASPQDISVGYKKSDNKWLCLLCNAEFEDGMVYEFSGKYYEAYRAVAEHVKLTHGSVFQHLLNTQRKYTGLTQHQENVLGLMAAGYSDKLIAEQTTGNKNTTTIRNLRFQLKEREKQAKAFLALMEAFRMERDGKQTVDTANSVTIHTGAALADERFSITEKEHAAVLKAYFNADGTLKEFPVREKRKIIALFEISRRFDKGRIYTEKEVNTLIAYADFATIRRYLIEYGFLERTMDCMEYRVKEQNNE